MKIIRLGGKKGSCRRLASRLDFRNLGARL